MDQPRIGSGSCAGDDPKVGVAVRTAGRIRWCKLSPVEQIEKLNPELKPCTILPPQRNLLEHCEVKVADSIGAQRRIHARLASEDEVGRSSEAAPIEPAVEPDKSAGRAGLIAGGQHIRARSGPK